VIGLTAGNTALRIVIAVVGVVVVGGSLAGCSRFGDRADSQPAAVSSSTTPAPATGSGSNTGTNASNLASIQADLNAADSSTSNAQGDVAAADAASATNDNG
jgi:hypothetical protein